MFNFQIVKQHITHINDDIQEHAPPKASTASQALEKSNLKNRTKNKVSFGLRVAEVAREHGWQTPKSLDSDENFEPKHTLFCRDLRFVAIYALFFGDLWA